jgi:cellobiose phosphorylase
MYRLALESLLGLRLEGDKLHLAPCLPANWPGFKLRYRYRDTLYHIAVVRDESGSVAPSAHVISLVDDRREHRLEVKIALSPGAQTRRAIRG